MKGTFASLVVALVLAGCGGVAGPERESSSGCGGVMLRGSCWTAHGGISLSAERVARVVERAEAYWGQPQRSLLGWRLDFGPDQVVVDGTTYDGYCWAESRQIHVATSVPDCFERSAIFHELGHAWGFEEGDPRMSNEWRLIQAAVANSGWEGCE